MEQLKSWFTSLEEKEQKITLAAALGIFIFILYFALIEPINDSAASLKTEVIATQKTIVWMKKQIPIIQSKRGSGISNNNPMPLSSVVNSTTGKYQLLVSRRDSKSPNEMQVWFDNVAFDSFLSWVAEIKSRYGVAITSVNIRSIDADGTTSINVKLFK